MVLRNGKRIVCLKLRRSDDSGIEDSITYADDITDNEWDRGAKIPGGIRTNVGSASYPDLSMGGAGAAANYPMVNIHGGGQTASPEYGNGGANGMSMMPNQGGGQGQYGAGFEAGNNGFDYSKMHRIQNTQQFDPAASNLASQYRFGSGFSEGAGSNISIELGTDANVENLENLWDNLSGKYSKILRSYEPFFSVDAPADGQGKELFHLRIGPVKTLDEGDSVCSKLGRNGVFCSVVRTQ